MVRAVIFDLDGTLTDSLESIKFCADAAIGKFGFAPYDKERYKYFVGDGAAKLIERCLAGQGDENLVYFDRAYAAYREIFAKHCMYKVKPYKEIPPLLERLKAAGIKMAVLSNKPHAETVDVIETLFGRGCFDVIQGQTPEIARKPSPEGVFRILERLGLSARQTIYVGDTCTDMQTGKSAGAFTAGALWGFRDRRELEENHADVILENPLQLLDYVPQNAYDEGKD